MALPRKNLHPLAGKKPRGGGKGQDFERGICQRLSLWVSNFVKEDCFWRSAMSGGRYTRAKKKGKRHTSHSGDIAATSEEGYEFINHFYVECKSYKDFYWHLLGAYGKGLLSEFWKVAKREAKDVERLPLLIGKQNFLITFICLDSVGAGMVMRAARSSLSPLMIVPSLDLHLFSLQDFLMEVPFENLKKEIASWRKSLSLPTSTLPTIPVTSTAGKSSTTFVRRRMLED